MILKILLILSVTTTLVFNFSSAITKGEEHETSYDHFFQGGGGGGGGGGGEGSPSVRAMSHWYNPSRTMTCDRYPRVCRANGSVGPDCCRKRCVNVETDVFNCGSCGRRCRYGHACCHGKCVNIVYDRDNCGFCKNKCKKGVPCVYGTCSYA